MSVRRLTFALAAALEAGLLAGAAQAQVQLKVPEGCGTEQQFLGELALLIGNVEATHGPLQILLQSGPAGEPFTLRVSHEGFVRELSDADCTELFRSAVVIAATQLRGVDPEGPLEKSPPGPLSEADARRQGSKPQRSEPPGSEPRAPMSGPANPTKPRNVRTPQTIAVPESTPHSDASPEGNASKAAHVQLGLALGLVVGETPGVSPALEAHVAVEGPLLGARLAVFGLSGGREEREARGVRVYEWGARGLFTLRPVPRLYAGVGASVGRFVGVGRNLGASESAGVWDIAPTLEVGVSALRRERVSLELALSGKWSAIRPRFEISGSNFTVYQVPALGAGLWLRGAWRLD